MGHCNIAVEIYGLCRELIKVTQVMKWLRPVTSLTNQWEKRGSTSTQCPYGTKIKHLGSTIRQLPHPPTQACMKHAPHNNNNHEGNMGGPRNIAVEIMDQGMQKVLSG